jgi:hypothetical protein
MHPRPRLFLCIAALLAALGGCATKPPPEPDAMPKAASQALPEERIRDRFILPGERVGPVSLRMPLRQLISAMGEPVSSTATRIPAGRPALLYRYADPDASVDGAILVMVREHDQTVYSVQVDRSESYQTRECVRFGSSEALVRASFGKPQSVRGADANAPRTYCYLNGLAVRMDAAGSVESITVFPGPDLRKICKAQ